MAELSLYRNVLYVQYWDIIQEKEEEYEKFVIEEYIPKIKQIGFNVVGGYYVEVGQGPGVIACLSMDDPVGVNELVISNDFIELTNKLAFYIRNRKAVLLFSTGRVSKGAYKIQENVWKLNYHYNVKPNKKPEYREFIKRLIDIFDKIEFVELTEEWRVLYGGEADYIVEFSFKDPYDIGRLMRLPEFRDVEKEVRKNFVEVKSSKILRCTERFEKPRWLKL